jgi:hypothetical protein
MLDELGAQLKIEEMQKLITTLEKQAKVDMVEAVADQLSEAARDMWPQLLSLYKETSTKTKDQFRKMTSGG